MVDPDTNGLLSFMANVPPTATVADTSLRARLNTKGTNVVCGMRDCGTRLAYVGHPTAEEIAHSEQTGASALACIQFLPGWAPGCDGIWAAISLPDPVLGSRSIRIPLVRTSDPHRVMLTRRTLIGGLVTVDSYKMTFGPQLWPCSWKPPVSGRN